MTMHKIVFVIGFLFSVILYSQSDSITRVQYDDELIQIQKFDSNRLDNYRKDSKFDYSEVSESNWAKDFANWLEALFSSLKNKIFPNIEFNGFWNTFFQILPYLLIVFMVFLLFRFLINAESRSLWRKKSFGLEVEISSEEDILKNEDITLLIKKALSDQNYRLAVRYYYLYSLKLLSDKGLIAWEPEKTNADYVKELTLTHQKQDFMKITRIYDFVWYGNFDIGEEQFYMTEKEFNHLEESLQN